MDKKYAKGNGNQNKYLNEAVCFAAGTMVAWLVGEKEEKRHTEGKEYVAYTSIYTHAAGGMEDMHMPY